MTLKIEVQGLVVSAEQRQFSNLLYNYLSNQNESHFAPSLVTRSITYLLLGWAEKASKMFIRPGQKLESINKCSSDVGWEM